MPELDFIQVLRAEIVARGAATGAELRRSLFLGLCGLPDAEHASVLDGEHIRDWSRLKEFLLECGNSKEDSPNEGCKLSAELLKELKKELTTHLQTRILEALNTAIGSRQPIVRPSTLPAELLEFYNAAIREQGSAEPSPVLNRLLLSEAHLEIFAAPAPARRVLHQWLHQHPATAVCLSGGGIRSATFALGVIQGLATHGLLKSFDYLSTVSGGGYIGSWLSCWIHRTSLDFVSAELDRKQPRDPSAPEPAPVSYLRQYSNYLTPRLGLTSADTWTLIGTYLRNLILNWVIFIPFIAAVLMVPRICVSLLSIDLPLAALASVGVIGALGAIWAIRYVAIHLPRRRARQRKDGQTRFLLFCLAPLAVSAMAFTGFWCWLQEFNPAANRLRELLIGADRAPSLKEFLVLGAGIHVISFLIYIWQIPLGGRFWRVVGRVLREFLICLVVGLVGGALLYLGCVRIFQFRSFSDIPDLELYVCAAAPVFLAAFLLAGVLFIGLVSRFSTDSEREWWGRMGAWVLIVLLGWLLFSSLIIFGPNALLEIPRITASAGGLAGLITLLLSHSGSTAANRQKSAEAGIASKVSNLVLGLAAPLFIAALLAAISLGISALIIRIDPVTVYSSASLGAEDIQDWPMFASELKAASSPAARFLLEHLSPALQFELKTNRFDGALPDNLQKRLQREVKTVLAENDLDWRVFGQDGPPFPTNGSPVESRQYKRMLLERAFPLEVRQDPFDHLVVVHKSPVYLNVMLFLLLAALTFVLSRSININYFSLHGVYRDRLIRAYLGASNSRRHPNPFSGFDPDDNVPMCRLPVRPFHIVNMALNLTAGEKLAWQQRKAASFTASPLHAGSSVLGYRPVAEYASGRKIFRASIPFVKRERGHTRFFLKKVDAEIGGTAGLTTGTAVTISGAAASPNMGYHSSPVLAVLMTLFNVRLGAWLGNPGPAGEHSFMHATPRYPFAHLLKEACGLATENSEYVYLSDGGHFENLGLYEMVLRRCRTIIVSDAGCDPKCGLEDLGNAIRKIRVDLGISIEIDDFGIVPRRRKIRASKYCAAGTINYRDIDGPDAPAGTLIYIKPALSGNEPRDVFSYRESSLAFPHEPTSDQWFSESQFESYRALGFHIIRTLASVAVEPLEKPEDPLSRFLRQADTYLGRTNHQSTGQQAAPKS